MIEVILFKITQVKLNKTKDHLTKTIEKLRSEQKSVQDQLVLLDAPLENQEVETKTERQESIANSCMGKITKEVDKLKSKLEDAKLKIEELENEISQSQALSQKVP